MWQCQLTTTEDFSNYYVRGDPMDNFFYLQDPHPQSKNKTKILKALVLDLKVTRYQKS